MALPLPAGYNKDRDPNEQITKNIQPSYSIAHFVGGSANEQQWVCSKASEHRARCVSGGNFEWIRTTRHDFRTGRQPGWRIGPGVERDCAVEAQGIGLGGIANRSQHAHLRSDTNFAPVAPEKAARRDGV